MIVWLRHLLGWMVSAFRSRKDLALENLALRQQLLALHTPRPRHQFPALHKLFWVALRTCWSGWKKPLVLVTPRTVVNWHRAGFRLYWRWVSRAGQIGGRKRVSKDVRALIFRMVAENPTWGAPRIHGELLKLGFDVSERSVSRWIRRAPRDPDPIKRWLTFLSNHRVAIAAMDFFTVPTLTEKKNLSLARDRRNTYGENLKASRKGIRRGKQRSYMKERRAVGHVLRHLTGTPDESEAIEADVRAKTLTVEKKRKGFKKKADAPLGVVIKRKLARRDKLGAGQS